MDYVLTLPYPVSINRYFKTRVVTKYINGKKVAFPNVYISTEAKQYKTTVGTLYLSKKYPKIHGKVDVEWWLYPHRPLDWSQRAERDFQNWELSVEQLDIDNPTKILLDALKDVAFDDDKMVRNLFCHMMEPDGKGARIVVSIQPTELKVREELFA